MSNWNQEGAACWRWVFGLAALLVLIVAAFWFRPESSPPVRAPVRAPVVVRGKILPPPAPASGQPPAAQNVAPAPKPPQPVAMPTDASPGNPGTGAPVLPAADRPAVVSGEKIGAPVQQTADSAQADAGGLNDAAEPGREIGVSAQKPPESPSVAESATPGEARPDNDAAVRKEAPPAPDRSAAEGPPQKETPAVAPLQKAPFTVQVGAFRHKVYADELLDLLRKRGYSPFIFIAERPRKSDLYTVRFGRFASREAAAEAAAGFKQKENMAAVAVHAGSL